MVVNKGELNSVMCITVAYRWERENVQILTCVNEALRERIAFLERIVTEQGSRIPILQSIEAEFQKQLRTIKRGLHIAEITIKKIREGQSKSLSVRQPKLEANALAIRV